MEIKVNSVSDQTIERARWLTVPGFSSGLCSMKRLGTLLLPPGWDASPSQGTQYEATRRIYCSPGWDAGPPQDTQHEATRNITTPPWIGCSPSQGSQHEETRSITTPPWMMMLVHRRVTTQHEANRRISTPPWMGCKSITGFPPSMKQLGALLLPPWIGC